MIDDDIEIGFYVIAYLAYGTFATIEAARSLINRSIETDLLMVTAAIGAAITGESMPIIKGSGD